MESCEPFAKFSVGTMDLMFVLDVARMARTSSDMALDTRKLLGQEHVNRFNAYLIIHGRSD